MNTSTASASLARLLRASVLVLAAFLVSGAFSFAQLPGFIREEPVERLTANPKYRQKLEILKTKLSNEDARLVTFGDLAQLQSKGLITFSIPGRKELVASQTLRVEYKSPTDYTYFGTTLDGLGSVILIRKGEEYTGSIHVPDADYQIFHIEKDVHAITRKPPLRGQFCGTKDVEVTETGKPIPRSGARVDACFNPIRLLVLWTPAARIAVGNDQNTINNIVNSSVSQFNNCIYRSNITSAATVTLIGSEEWGFQETGDVVVEYVVVQ